jgi:hypothetical protein
MFSKKPNAHIVRERPKSSLVDRWNWKKRGFVGYNYKKPIILPSLRQENRPDPSGRVERPGRTASPQRTRSEAPGIQQVNSVRAPELIQLRNLKLTMGLTRYFYNAKRSHGDRRSTSGILLLPRVPDDPCPLHRKLTWTWRMGISPRLYQLLK